jgi:alkylhydroperoxidase family enzyme
MTRIRWIEPDQATGRIAELYDRLRPDGPGGPVPGVALMMSLSPVVLEHLPRMIFGVHFTDQGFLTRTQHELIACYVMALQRSHSGLSFHAHLLRARDEAYAEVARAMRDGRLGDLPAPVTEAETALLRFAGTLATRSREVTDAQVDELRRLGWTDEQIAETVYLTGLGTFAAMMGNAWGVVPPPVLDGADGVPRAVTEGAVEGVSPERA